MKKYSVRMSLGIFALFLSLFVAVSPSSAKQFDAKNIKSITNVTGELEIIEECEETRGRTLYFLNTGNERLPIKLKNQSQSELRNGDRIKVKGVRTGDTVVADSVERVALSTESLTGTTGDHKLLVILVNFQDKQTRPFSVEQARDVTFNTTSNYFREASYGQTWLTGDVYGWYTIPVSSANCDTAAIATYAKQAAANAGANLAAYNHYVYAFPSNACTFTGRGSVGGSPSQAWINEWFELGIVGHELGHNLGLYHSRSMDCGSVSVGGTCTTDEYGDTLDLMGSANSAHFNAFQKEQLGWVNSTGLPSLQTVFASGTYWIDSYVPGGTNPKGLKILKSTDPVTGKRTWYYVERRTATGFDNFLSTNVNVLSGVLVHTGSEANPQDTYLLDMTPFTSSWYDPALVAGQSFSDPGSGMTLTTLSVDSTGAWVRVDMTSQPCSRSNPTVTVNPGQTQWLRSGSAFNYSVTVTNNDDDGCSIGNFELQTSLPDGWTAGFSSPVLNVGPRGSATATLSVTSPISAADGSYGVGVTAVNSSSRSNVGTASASYVIVSALAVGVSSSSKYTRTQKATVTATVTAAGLPLSGAAVTFTMTKPNGSVVTQNATAASNGTAVFTYSFSKRQDPTGTYRVTAVSTANGATGQGSTSFSVSK